MDCRYFTSGSVVWDLASTDKFEAIRETILRTGAFRVVPSLDVDAFVDAVVAREREQSTGFGHGIAIAHGRAPEVSDGVVALGISRRGIDFDSFDGKPVHLLFVVANHPDKHVDYLRILSSLAILARQAQFRESILSALCQEDVEHTVGVALNGVLQRVAG